MNQPRKSASSKSVLQGNLWHAAPRPLAKAVAFAIAAWSAGAHAGPALNAAWINQQAGRQAAADAARIGQMTQYGATLTAQQVQQINAQTRLSIANLGQVAQAAAAAAEAQRKAREAARNSGSSVTDGLGEGGLKVDTNAATAGWSGADNPTQTVDPTTGRVLVGINQTAERAILNWETFNIGRNTSLNFNQQSNWAVLNRVNDPSARPSQIQGQLSGAGTIMILNRNGVIFSGTSQVDTGNLVAAAARMTDDQFRNNGIYSATVGTGLTPSFTDANGKLIVEGGAQIKTRMPQSVTEGGGYVLLLGSEVQNNGSISTPRGQTELAAGDSFILRPGYSTDSNQISTTQGSEISARRVANSTAGLVTNTGMITAERGDITLVGHDVQQNGVALATTSVSQRGTIHLLNSASDTTGKVTFGQGSVTSVLIEDSTETALDSQRQALLDDSKVQDQARATAVFPAVFDNLSHQSDRRDQSRIEVVSGGAVNFGNQSLTLATGGQISVSAAGRTFVADGARLDVSGAPAVKVAMESNNVKISVQGNEQRDAPDSRDNGKLNSNDVWVDVRDLVLVPAGTGGYATDRYYTPGGLLEVSGYLGTTGHTIGEWAAVGGTVRLAGKEVITQKGSNINLAGGVVVTADGFIRSSWVRGSDGLLYDVNRAPGDMTYNGVYNGWEVDYARWGVTDRFYNVAVAPVYRWQKGYVTGRDAGSLTIDAPTAVVEGDVNANVLQGERQTAQRAAGVTDGYKATQNTVARAGQFALEHFQVTDASPTQPAIDVRFTNDEPSVTAGMSADDKLADARVGTAWFDAARFSGYGLGGLDVYTGTSVRVDGALTLADGGRLRFVAPHIDINANITARAGSIQLGNKIDKTTGVPETYLGIDGKAYINVGNNAALDVRGKWVNAFRDGNDSAALAYIDGGSVDIASSHDVTIGAGTRIDASSGGAVLRDSSLHGGRGGSISLTANGPGAIAPGMIADPAATLHLDGELRGYGAGQGGTLSISSGTIRIGGADQPGVGELVLPTSLFSSGFSSYVIDGQDSMSVAADTQVRPERPVYRLDMRAINVPTGTDPAEAMSLWLPPEYLENPAKGILTQRAGASLTLRSSARYDATGRYVGGGTIDIAKGSEITVDSGQTIRVDGKEQITVDGTLRAHGGDILIVNTRAPGGGKTNVDPGQLSVMIGDNAVIDVSARAVTAQDAFGRTYGQVSDGGNIVLGNEGGIDPNDATRLPHSTDAFIIVRPGAVLDASGTHASLATGQVQDRIDPHFLDTMDVASNGGSITVRSYSGFSLDGTLRAFAGGASAAGGTLALELETPMFSTNNRPGLQVPDSIRQPREIVVSQHDLASSPYTSGRGTISSDRVQAGGFDNLSLNSRDLITFSGDVDLHLGQSLSLRSTWLGVDGTGTHVSLSAPYVQLAKPAQDVLPTATDIYAKVQQTNGQRPSTGAALNVSADLIDLNTDISGVNGTIQLNQGTRSVSEAGFDVADFESRGDIRLNGQVAGVRELKFGAAQVYGNGIVTASDHIVFSRTTDTVPEIPYSVFGSISVFAKTIDQGGILRAPLGQIQLGDSSSFLSPNDVVTEAVNLLPGSITSVSAAGLVIPYGGTTDGVSYVVDGVDVSTGNGVDLSTRLSQSGITIGARKTNVESGATLDLSGGGELKGAAFISGRGGSVDVLDTALRNASPSNTFSDANNEVYAIVPSSHAAYAPEAAGGAGTVPAIGKQITIPAGVPGLPPGTYTLMPSRYALLPGAFRVELGGAAGLSQRSVVPLRNGSFAVESALGVVNTGQRDGQSRMVILTSGDVVRKYSQYNETSYSDFARARAQTLGNAIPVLPGDGKLLTLNAADPKQAAVVLSFQGKAIFDAAENGNPGSVAIDTVFNSAAHSIEVLGPDGAPSAGFVSYRDSDLNAIGAPRLVLGGRTSQLQQGTITIDSQTLQLVLRRGATLTGPDIFLVAGDQGIELEAGASLNTLGQGNAIPFPSSAGYIYVLNSFASVKAASLIAASNSWLNFVPLQINSQTGGIKIGDARIYTEGSLTFALSGSGPLNLSNDFRYGARNLNIAVPNVNIGDGATLDQAARDNILPAGLQLDQDRLNRLLAGNDIPGVPALESLSLTATESLNFYGSAGLNTIDPITGKSSLAELVLNTPAIYGLGDANTVATLTTNRLVWNGISDGVPYAEASVPTRAGSLRPGVVRSGGAGTGSGRLDIVANDIVLGYGDNTKPDPQLTLDRLILGFNTVNLSGRNSITSNNKNTLSVYQSQGAYVDGKGYTYTGGNLNLQTPQLTGEAGSVNRFTAGGDLVLTALPGAGAAPTTSALGAEIGLTGNTVTLGSRVVLPSGKLTINAQGDIRFADGAQIDLAGRGKEYFDQTRYTPGGDMIVESTQGNVRQDAGSRIDLSAANASAGTLQVTATGTAGGQVDLAGQIVGAGASKDTSAAIDVRAQTVADFKGLNERLNASGVVGARSFSIKRGDLVIGDEINAHVVNISVDNGSLTVAGTIDASGDLPGSIRLSANRDLTLQSTARLDAHGNQLAVDSYGQAIDAPNRADIELTATNGTLTLEPGAAIDLRAADKVARGTLSLSASRTHASADPTDNDIKIDVSGPVQIDGAASIAVYGFRRYTDAPLDTTTAGTNVTTPTQVITQAWLDTLNQDSVNFMSGALGNGALLSRLGGLTTYGSTFHLRPGVEIDSATADGNLTVQGDLDLSGYRYGPGVTTVRGSGEPGALVIRAGGNLNILGSINDGFAPPPTTPDDNGWKLFPGVDQNRTEFLLPVALTLKGDAGTGTATVFSGVSDALDFSVNIRASTLRANALVPTRVTLNAAVTLPAGTLLRAAIRDNAGNVIYAAGTLLAQTTQLAVNTQVDAGSVLPVNLPVKPMTVPAGTRLGIFTAAVTLADNLKLAAGTRVPAGVNLVFADASGLGTLPSISTRTATNGRQGSVWAIAPMLAPGMLSWDMRIVAGADTTAADTRSLQAYDALAGTGNIRLSDPHYSQVNSFASALPIFSVVRTGTGDLDMLAGGDLSQGWGYGIYTAGTQSSNVTAAYNLPRGATQSNGSVLGTAPAGFEALTKGANYQAYFPEHGGDLTVVAQGTLSADTRVGDNDPSQWLWRQGGELANQPAAWWINFGTYKAVGGVIMPTGATGFGTFGGGDVSIASGGDAGSLSNRSATRSSAFNVVVASTGRMQADGTLLQTGGGNVDLNIGGTLNPQRLTTGAFLDSSILGSYTDLRGDMKIDAGAIGFVALGYGTPSAVDPRRPDPFTAYSGTGRNGIVLVPGDSSISIAARGDIVLNTAIDATMSTGVSGVPYTFNGLSIPGFGVSRFSLWRDSTAISLYSGGGNIVPYVKGGSGAAASAYPANLFVAAANGSIYMPPVTTGVLTSIELMPSATGQLEFLAGQSIYGNMSSVDISGADPSALATPQHPNFVGTRFQSGRLVSVTDNTASNGDGNIVFLRGPDTPIGNLHAGDTNPARFYAVDGDIVGLRTGEIINFDSTTAINQGDTWYMAAKPVWVLAGRDIVGAGTQPGAPTRTPLGGGTNGSTSAGNLFVHNNPGDISVVSAGRDIYSSNFSVAGPGLLEVTAGRNLYQAGKGSLESLGPIVDVDAKNRSSGASISVMAGIGADGIDYKAFAERYLVASNQANPNFGLDDPRNTGKVAKTYQDELLTWMQSNYGYQGDAAGAVSAFEALNPHAQGIFVRQVFFTELRDSGREFNDKSSPRAGSYLRGREAIATLFPEKRPDGTAINYGGDLTMFGASGIHTNFGGDIQVLTPGGRTIVGVDGVPPPSTAGLLTQGFGNIQMYSQGSILLGLSRVFTTFGGDILGWSAEGDINAGRGAKTSVVFSPPRRLYDEFGNVTLSPSVPTTGAGIATLNPIAEVPPGDIDLIAPLGTIDAGEAGIRVSGNVNLAALQVVNGANIQVQGKATGLPGLASVNVGALTNASAAASAVNQAAEDMARQQSASNRDRMPSVVSVQVLGFGEGGQ